MLDLWTVLRKQLGKGEAQCTVPLLWSNGLIYCNRQRTKLPKFRNFSEFPSNIEWSIACPQQKSYSFVLWKILYRNRTFVKYALGESERVVNVLLRRRVILLL